MAGLLNDMKQAIKKAGTNKGKILYFRPGVKMRVRFLHELDEGMKVLFHDSFELGVNHPCQELYDKECENHEREDLRHRDLYVWSVWDHEAKEVKLLVGAVNQYSPVPNLVSMYDTYGTMVDRDYVITKNGSQTSTTFTVVPLDKVKFKNEKAKAYSESKVLGILAKAYPCDSDGDDDEDEEPKPKKKKRIVEDDEDEDETPKKKAKAKKKKKPDYSEMSPRELYDLCIERDIKVKPKKDEEYYIDILEDYDLDSEENDDDGWN